jgi:hypothetical protein
MRVNIYEEEMTHHVEVVADRPPFTGIRFYLHLPATVDGRQYQGPFLHRPGDDDSAAVTFWGKDPEKLRQLLRTALNALEKC